MIEFRGLDCCGVYEIHGIQQEGKTPKSIVKEIAVDYFYENSRCAYYIFTCQSSKSIGKRLAKFVESNGLGTVTTLTSKRNPNSGNMIKMWMWAVNMGGLNKYYTEPVAVDPVSNDHVMYSNILWEL